MKKALQASVTLLALAIGLLSASIAFASPPAGSNPFTNPNNIKPTVQCCAATGSSGEEGNTESSTAAPTKEGDGGQQQGAEEGQQNGGGSQEAK